MTFTKLDKKVLIILAMALALVIILAVGLVTYKYLAKNLVKVQNSAGGLQTEQKAENNSGDQNKPTTDAPQAQIRSGKIQAQGTNGGGTLSIYLDKCGDGVCQKTDPNCGKDNNLNCICPETPKALNYETHLIL